MQRGRVHISVTAGFCVIMAISLCILPLRWVCSWLLALTVHELCHYVAVIACGSELRKLKLTLGGAEMIADINSAGQETLCALAGPLGGLLLLFFHKSLPITALCAFVHSSYNLLPLKNLDGGRALLGLLRMLFRKDRAEAACDRVDRILRILLFVSALYISWRIRWWMLTLFACILLFVKDGRIKSTCKRNRLQVQ